MQTKLGKIKSIDFGWCGYQHVEIGFKIDIGGQSWSETYVEPLHWGHVSEYEINGSLRYKWTQRDRLLALGEGLWKIFNLIRKADVDNMQDLVGVPIEAKFKDNVLVDFDILEDCI